MLIASHHRLFNIYISVNWWEKHAKFRLNDVKLFNFIPICFDMISYRFAISLLWLNYAESREREKNVIIWFIAINNSPHHDIEMKFLLICNKKSENYTFVQLSINQLKSQKPKMDKHKHRQSALIVWLLLLLLTVFISLLSVVKLFFQWMKNQKNFSFIWNTFTRRMTSFRVFLFCRASLSLCKSVFLFFFFSGKLWLCSCECNEISKTLN